MNVKLFTKKEIEILSNNKYIKHVSAKVITYTDEFKRTFIAEYELGKTSNQIFRDNGFEVEMLGRGRIKSASERWRAAYKKHGVCGLEDTRKLNSGRLNEKNLSLEEKYSRLEAELNLVKAENELLKKLDLMERRLSKKK